MKPPFVRVEWDDAWADTDEFVTPHAIEKTHRAMRITTMGWLLHEDEHGLSVANEASTDAGGTETYRGRTFIPRGMILSVTRLRVAKIRDKAAKRGPTL